MKFKVGDRVRVIDRIHWGNSGERLNLPNKGDIFILEEIVIHANNTSVHRPIKGQNHGLLDYQIELVSRPAIRLCTCHPQEEFTKFCLNCIPKLYP